MDRRFLIIMGALVLVFFGFIMFSRKDSTSSKPAGPAQIVRENSHKLDSAPDEKATLVEFLDFECEACGGNYPIIEQVRKEYEGKLNFYIRYFPLPNHSNARTAARAVEAAFQQDKGEEMYQLMYTNQKMWAEQQNSQAPVFRKYAEQLELDMTKFDKDVASAETNARINLDVSDGQELGVNATPTFYFNGKKLDGVQQYEELKKMIDEALAKN